MLTVPCPCGATYVLDAETLPVEERAKALADAMAFAQAHREHVRQANANAIHREAMSAREVRDA